MSDAPSTSWATWAWQAYREGRLVEADTVQAQIDEVKLRKTLHDLITEQSEGEWDDKTINTDVEVFLTAILALMEDQP